LSFDPRLAKTAKPMMLRDRHEHRGDRRDKKKDVLLELRVGVDGGA
jgi:hypothetical protein